MKKTMKALALLLALVMLISVLPAAVFAEETEETADKRFGRISVDPIGTTGLSDAAVQRKADGTQKTALPTRYDSRDYGCVTAVRNQNPYGSCWAHGAMASVESYMIKHGVKDGSTGAAAKNTMNLSEYHLAWYNYTYAYDKLGMLTGDRSIPYSNYLDLGGFGEMATYTLMRWEGPASESTSALAYSNASVSGLGSSYAWQNNVAHVQGVDWIPTKNMDGVKQAIMEYGAGTFGYCHIDDYGNDDTGAYCYIQSGSSYYASNHDVTVVGWDDNYSRNNFNSISQPSKNGAWIVKNSWGSDFGDKGYYYISYEDTASLNDICYFYQVEALDNYDNIYQYDGTNNFSNCYNFDNGSSIASVFQANGSETLKAVSICTWDEGMRYKLSIYRGCSTGNPSSGTLAATQSGSIAYQGYHTIRLNQPVSLNAGERYSVVFELSNDYNSEFYVPVDQNGSASQYVTWVHAAHPNTSFAKRSWESDWWSTEYDGDYYNVRIKAYTTNDAPVDPPKPNDTPFVDVDPNGYYYDAVVWAVNNGITNGTDATHFGPTKDCTRGQVVTFLWRTKGSPEPSTTVSPFFDVTGGYYYKAVLWAVEHGITAGTDPTHFKPDNPCTRGQVVTFLWRTAGSPNPNSSSSPFKDVDSNAYYYKAMLWAVEKGITKGVNDISFAPSNTCTRAQIVTFLYRAKDHMTGSLGTVTVVDKRELYNAIAEAESYDQNRYTTESWANLASALSSARTVYNNGSATQTEVNNAASALWSAINKLVEKPNSGGYDSYVLGSWYSYALYNSESGAYTIVDRNMTKVTLNANHSGTITINGNSYSFTWEFRKVDDDGDYMYLYDMDGDMDGFYYITESGELWFFVGTFMIVMQR